MKKYGGYDVRTEKKLIFAQVLKVVGPNQGIQTHSMKHYRSETVVCLRGRLVEEYYDDLERMCTEAIELSPNGPVVALNIPAGQWHTARALESGTVILEMKDGPYEPTGPEDILDDIGIVGRLRRFMEEEARSCSMDPGCITPEYVFRMWGGSVPLEEIEAAMKLIRK